MSNPSYLLANRRHYGLLGTLTRIKLLWWAVLGRPIIYRVQFEGGIELSKDNRNVLVANNVFMVNHTPTER
ncbi:unnamed protein product [marine sediment metagenome]|uniref:Uncharacterized protein n=1 Tax=marine sediment metagenome TaxID=412755 RepID=X1V596_9ZZZZ